MNLFITTLSYFTKEHLMTILLAINLFLITINLLILGTFYGLVIYNLFEYMKAASKFKLFLKEHGKDC